MTAAGVLAMAATAAAAGFRHYGGTAVVAVVDPPSTADPVQASTSTERMLSALVHCSLFEAGPAGTVEPLLVSPDFRPPTDGHNYLITLANDVRFANGNAITAEDVSDSLERLAGSDAGWLLDAVKGRDAVASGDADRLAGLRVLGERRLLLETTRPFYGLEHLLAAPEAAITERGGAVDPFWGPPGAGPFQPVDAGDDLVLQPSPRFVRGRPFVDRLVFRRAADDLTAASWLSRGQADAAFSARKSESIESATVVLLLADSMPDDERERALAAIDRGVLTEVFLRGKAQAAVGLLPPSILPRTRSLPEVVRPKSPQAVRRTLWAPRELNAVAERLAVDLLAAGVLVERRTAPVSEIRKRAREDSYDLLLFEWRPAALDPALAMWEWSVRPSLKPVAGNLIGQLRQLPTLKSADDRLTEARKLESALLATHRVFPLFHPVQRLQTSDRIRGVGTDPRGRPTWADAWLTPDAAEDSDR